MLEIKIYLIYFNNIEPNNQCVNRQNEAFFPYQPPMSIKKKK